MDLLENTLYLHLICNILYVRYTLSIIVVSIITNTYVLCLLASALHYSMQEVIMYLVTTFVYGELLREKEYNSLEECYRYINSLNYHYFCVIRKLGE
jgi:hypothetical protein